MLFGHGYLYRESLLPRAARFHRHLCGLENCIDWSSCIGTVPCDQRFQAHDHTFPVPIAVFCHLGIHDFYIDVSHANFVRYLENLLAIIGSALFCREYHPHVSVRSSPEQCFNSAVIVREAFAWRTLSQVALIPEALRVKAFPGSSTHFMQRRLGGPLRLYWILRVVLPPYLRCHCCRCLGLPSRLRRPQAGGELMVPLYSRLRGVCGCVGCEVTG
jgi:hypothetical protein